MDSLELAYEQYCNQHDEVCNFDIPRVIPCEADLQYILDNAFILDHDELFENFSCIKEWTSLKPENVKNPECLLLLAIMYGVVTEELKNWMANPHTDLKILYLMIDKCPINVYDVDLDLLFQKSNHGLTPNAFKEIVSFFEECSDEEKVIVGLINWYRPISHSGVLHFYFIEQCLYDQYLLLSEQYPFDIYNNLRIEHDHFVPDDKYYEEACVTFTKNNISHESLSITLLVLKNNFHKFNVHEKQMFIEKVKQFINNDEKINDCKSTNPILFQIIDDDEIFDCVKPEMHMYFSRRLILSRVSQCIQAGVMSKIIQFAVEVYSNKKTKIECKLILNGTRKQLDGYFGSYSQKSIDDVMRSYTENMSLD